MRRAATSRASTGWSLRPPGTGKTGSFAVFSTIVSARSWNWAARRVVHGIPEPATARSDSSFVRIQASGTRSAPVTEE